jgi:hypothetical protein
MSLNSTPVAWGKNRHPLFLRENQMPKHKGDPYRLNEANAASHFWSLVDQSGGPHACWPWTRSRVGVRKEYGVFHWNGFGRAHCAAYYFATGRRSKTICHTCDNPICCNPRHLYAGTQNSNMQDMARRNRTCSKLTYDDVRVILEELHVSGPIMAWRMGVTRTAINRIRRGGTWKYHDARSQN